MMLLKEQIAEKLFPFEMYLSGKFNHNDVLEAICKMGDIVESFYGNVIIEAYKIEAVKHIEGLTANEEIK